MFTMLYLLSLISMFSTPLPYLMGVDQALIHFCLTRSDIEHMVHYWGKGRIRKNRINRFKIINRCDSNHDHVSVEQVCDLFYNGVMLHPTDFFDLSDPLAHSLFMGCDAVWSAIPAIKQHVKRLTGETQTILGTVMAGATIGDAPIYIGEGAVIEPGAWVQGPAYIAAGATVRHGAYVRANVIMLSGSILGHASEAKNAIFLHNAHAPHFNYVGDGILGNNVNLGAGTKLSNLGMLSDKDGETGQRPTIKIAIDNVLYDTGLAKMGGILGDNAQTGCNSVLNPGCLVGRNTLIYANSSLRKGYYPPSSIVKLRQTIQTVVKK